MLWFPIFVSLALLQMPQAAVLVGEAFVPSWSLRSLSTPSHATSNPPTTGTAIPVESGFEISFQCEALPLSRLPERGWTQDNIQACPSRCFVNPVIKAYDAILYVVVS